MSKPRQQSESSGSTTSGTATSKTSQTSSGSTDVTQKASQMVDQAQQTATQAASAQKQQVTKGAGNVADALRQVAGQLRKQDQDTVAHFADEAASQVDSFAGYLRGQNVTQMFDEVDRFARQQPMIFLGGAFALGLLAARFLKASPEGAEQNRASTGTGMYRNRAYYQPRYGYGTTGGYAPDYTGRSPRYASGAEYPPFGTRTTYRPGRDMGDYTGSGGEDYPHVESGTHIGDYMGEPGRPANDFDETTRS